MVKATCCAILAGALALGSGGMAYAQEPAQAATPATRPQAFTFDNDVALWTVAIKPDKAADFERVMARLHDALMKSALASRREQALGWRIIRMNRPLPDGNLAFVHVINPVVAGADYTVMQILYDEFPDERQELYELYRGAFAQNLALAVGDVAVDMATARAPQVTASGH